MGSQEVTVNRLPGVQEKRPIETLGSGTRCQPKCCSISSSRLKGFRPRNSYASSPIWWRRYALHTHHQNRDAYGPKFVAPPPIPCWARTHKRGYRALGVRTPNNVSGSSDLSHEDQRASAKCSTAVSGYCSDRILRRKEPALSCQGSGNLSADRCGHADSCDLTRHIGGMSGFPDPIGTDDLTSGLLRSDPWRLQYGLRTFWC